MKHNADKILASILTLISYPALGSAENRGRRHEKQSAFEMDSPALIAQNMTDKRLAIGVPLVKMGVRTKIVTHEKVITRTKTLTKTRTKILKVQKNVDRYILDAGFINFQTQKYDVDSLSNGYLQELAGFLSRNRALWTGIYLRSHTDHRGSGELNAQLSDNRAAAVVSILTGQGLRAADMEIRSLSFNDPIEEKDDPLSLARNRRVEIEVVGARAILVLKGEIAKIRQKYRIPTTCTGEGCN